MGWNVDSSGDGGNTKSSGADGEARQTPEGPATTTGSKKSVILILAGLVVAGLVAGWDWVRKLPKD